MTRAEAHRLLDAARAGFPVSPQLISEALGATGDLLGNEAPLQIWRGVGDWGSTDFGALEPRGVFDGLIP
ncbi:MAG: hypothetical protein ABI054_09605 [Planctomycetota bacterium]